MMREAGAPLPLPHSEVEECVLFTQSHKTFTFKFQAKVLSCYFPHTFQTKYYMTSACTGTKSRNWVPDRSTHQVPRYALSL